MSDPYAVRARTHRADNWPNDPWCQRCRDPWPCAKAGKVDPETSYRWALLAGAVAGVGACIVGVAGWFAGWWG